MEKEGVKKERRLETLRKRKGKSKEWKKYRKTGYRQKKDKETRLLSER